MLADTTLPRALRVLRCKLTPRLQSHSNRPVKHDEQAGTAYNEGI